MVRLWRAAAKPKKFHLGGFRPVRLVFLHCQGTKAGTGTKAQLAVCGSVNGLCALQHPPEHTADDDTQTHFQERE